MAADHASFAALKEEDGLNHTKKGFLKLKNAELKSNQAAEQQQTLQLAKSLEQMKEKVTTLEQEKDKYKGIFKELEAKLRIDREAWEGEKEHWKDKSFDMLQKLQAEENTLKAVKKKGAELAKNVVSLTKTSEQHSQQNKELKDRLTVFFRSLFVLLGCGCSCIPFFRLQLLSWLRPLNTGRDCKKKQQHYAMSTNTELANQGGWRKNKKKRPSS